MSRSHYTEDYCDSNEIYLYRANVDRAIAGKRGQAFLREMLAAFDAMPEKRLIHGDFELTPEIEAARRARHAWYAGEREPEYGVCAIGAVGKARGTDMSDLGTGEDSDPYFVGLRFGIARCLAAELEYENDDLSPQDETPEQRFARVRAWVESQIRPEGTG